VKTAEVDTVEVETKAETTRVETVEVTNTTETSDGLVESQAVAQAVEMRCNPVESQDMTHAVGRRDTPIEPLDPQAFQAACRRASRSFDAREERLLRASRILEESESASAADLDLVTDDAESSKHMPEPDFHKLLDQQIEAKQRNAKNAKGHGWLGLFCCQ